MRTVVPERTTVLIGFATWLVIFSVVAAGYAQDSISVEKDLADRLVNAPVLDSRHSQLRSLHATGHVSIDEIGRLAFRCWYEAPHHRACLVSHNDVPFFVAVGNQILAYGPVDGPMLFQGDWFVSFRVDGKESALNWGVLSPGNADARIEIDLRILRDVVEHHRSAPLGLKESFSPLGEKRFLLTTRSEAGGALDIWLDLSRSFPSSRLRGSNPKGTGFELARLTANEPVASAAFRFPRFAETFNLTPTTVTLDKLGDILQRVMLSMFSRFALSSVEWRSRLDGQLSPPLDWERLRARDAAIAPLLKSLVADHEQLP
jgi:hypothetical protein